MLPGWIGTRRDNGGSAITDYDMQVRPSDTTAWRRGNPDINGNFRAWFLSGYVVRIDHTDTIINLQSGTEYEVRVLAKNSQGAGPLVRRPPTSAP